MRLLALVAVFIVFSAVRSLKLLHIDLNAGSTYDTKAGLEYCRIPKTGSTILLSTLCDIQREFRGINFTQILNSTLMKVKKVLILSDCWHHKAFYRNHDTEAWVTPLRPVKFLVVREPVERFVSLYSFICERMKLCPDGTRIKKFAQDIYNAYNGDDNYIRVVPPIWGHVAPQSSFCNLEQTLHQYEIVYYSCDGEVLKQQLLRVFRRAQIPEETSQRALLHITMATTTHATDTDTSKALNEALSDSPITLKVIRAIYHRDYDLFGPFPDLS